MPYPTLPGRRFEYDIGGGSVYVGVKTNGTTSEAMVALTSEQMAGLNGIQKVSPVGVLTGTVCCCWIGNDTWVI